MARVTIEDCLKVVKNRFDLVHLAAKNARDIADLNSECGSVKVTVQASKNIAEGDFDSEKSEF